jgi:hypothetical protein
MHFLKTKIRYLSGGKNFCGAEGDRTLDLVNAIHALSQLSYSPGSTDNIKFMFKI